MSITLTATSHEANLYVNDAKLLIRLRLFWKDGKVYGIRSIRLFDTDAQGELKAVERKFNDGVIEVDE